jgi:hypothetical protein
MIQNIWEIVFSKRDSYLRDSKIRFKNISVDKENSHLTSQSPISRPTPSLENEVKSHSYRQQGKSLWAQTSPLRRVSYLRTP